MAPQSIHAVLFDFDGTLSDSEFLHREAWLEAVEPWGVDVGWREYCERFVGISDRKACLIFLEKAGRQPTDELISAACLRKHRCYRRRSGAELSIDDRVVAWVRASASKVPLGVVSSSATPDVIPILEKHGIADSMKFAICGDHVERLKPDPEPYDLAFEKLRVHSNVENAKDCLVFEDSPSGVASAKAAGMTVHRLAQPSELADALKQWQPSISAFSG